MRFSIFKKKPPLTTANVTLKFSRPTFANELGRAVVTHAFPAFLGDQEFDKEAEAKRMSAAGADQVFILEGGAAPRRFAGDAMLPRSRYFSVCFDELGNDGGTVTRELLGYYEGSSGHLAVRDLVMPDDAELLQKHCPDTPAGYVIELYSTPERPNPVAAKLLEEGLLSFENGELPETIGIFMPMEIKTETIENVFDMRQLKTQQWLASFLPKGDKLFSKDADPISSFVELLPDLTFYERGGNAFTGCLGTYLRLQGASGVIFPSARCDVGCEFLNGELNSFIGFNFVDYRGADRPISDSVRDYSPWVRQVFEGVTLRSAPGDSPFAHSWRIEGKEAAEDTNREGWMNQYYEELE